MASATMSRTQKTPKISLPKGWKKQVRSAVLHVLSQYAATYCGCAADSVDTRVRLTTERDRAVPGTIQLARLQRNRRRNFRSRRPLW